MSLLIVALASAGGAYAADGPPHGKPSGSGRDQQGRALVLGEGRRGAIKGRYIVVFRKGARDSDIERGERTANGRGAGVTRRYRKAIKGFAARLPDPALDAVRADPDVLFVEADAVVTASTTQTPAPWALDRVDQRNLPLTNTYAYDATGSGVDAYVIDTGIRVTHTQFGGRASSGFSSIDDGRGTADCDGHGTHVAGSVGGSTYGVAKAVRLYAVRVLDCQGSGTTSGVIAGVDWVTNTHQTGSPAVANMSLGGSASTALDNAVANSIADGVTYAVAAGNSNANACSGSPARVAAALTVGATTQSDARSSFSDYGTCLDLFAPGSSITSAWNTSDTATATASGTSMAAPHVAGVAALYLQGSPSASSQAVRDGVVNSATANVVTGPGTGSPNRLLYSLLTSPPPPPPSGCALAESYSGSLTGSGDYDYHPRGAIFYTPRSGIHRGCLRGPAGTDFDLYLWKWNGSAWVNVASGIGATSSEDVSYNGTAGYYVWLVASRSGAGSYSFGMTRP